MLSLRTYRTFTFSCYGISYIFYKKRNLNLVSSGRVTCELLHDCNFIWFDKTTHYNVAL